MNIKTKSIALEDGRTITIETGKLAKQADGSVVIKMGGTMLLATVVSALEANEGVDFMPLTVDYREKFAAAGRVPGGFLKREARPSDDEILVARLVDRALRPLFPKDYHAETVVMITLISCDKEVMADSLAGLAASAAIAVSDVPFECPISEVRVARINGEYVINPSAENLALADIDIMVGASAENIMMVEGEMDEVSEEEMLEAIKIAHDEIKKHCAAQEELMRELGVAKREYCHEKHDEELRKLIHDETFQKVYDAAAQHNADKKLRGQLFKEIKDTFVEKYSEGKEESEIDNFLIGQYYHDIEKEAVRRMVLDTKIRLDGRKTNEIRPIWGEVDYLPGAHGSAVFTRGETQSLTTVTLGNKLDEKMIDSVTKQGSERFMLHYNFPPFSTGEARTPRGLSRREIGHGNLAFRALKRMIPTGYPYTVRIVSDILESNGSSSMATVCAGTMSLMDTGVAIKRPVSGIAMGLISENNCEKYAVLSDILGDEDHLGDMDFKVTGTENGITATQMDMKVDGLSYDVLKEALMQAKDGRAHILGEMMKVIDTPNNDFRAHVPRVVVITIPKDFIGAVIGPGGKNIQKLQEETGTVITIETVDDHGRVEISGVGSDAIENAKERIRLMTTVPEVGETYDGKIVSIVDFGAFVEILPGKEALLHISEIAWERVANVTDVLKEGDAVKVKVIAIDEKTGKMKLSRRALLDKPEGYVEPPAREHRPPRSNDRDRGRNDRGDRNRNDRNNRDRR
ncbi:MAG: polyribonucleotide nucleotidyltransferase [Bacteroidales bacterium]